MRWNFKVKLKLTIVLTATVVLFAALGFWAITRSDPLGPFTLAMVPKAWLAIVLLAGLASICAAVAGLLLDRELPHVGWLVAGTGLLTMAFRSPPLSNLLIFYPLTGEPDSGLAPTGSLGGLYRWFLLETVILFVVVLVAYVLSRWVAQLLPTASQPQAAAPVGRGSGPSPLPREARLGFLSNSLMDLVSSLLGTGILALLLYLFLAGDSQRHGQIVFALAGGFFLGGLASHQVFQPRNPWGLIGSVPLVALLCYLFVVFGGADRPVFAYQAPGAIARPMPIDFIGVGIVAVMAAYLVSVRLLILRQREMAAKAASDS